MLKKVTIIMVMVVFAFSFTACKRDKAPAEGPGTKMEATATKIINAEDAASFAAALNEFIEAKEQLKAKRKAKKDKDCAVKKDKDCAAKKDKDCKFKKDCDFKEGIAAQIERFKDAPEAQQAIQRFEQKCAAKADKKGCERKGEKRGCDHKKK